MNTSAHFSPCAVYAPRFWLRKWPPRSPRVAENMAPERVIRDRRHSTIVWRIDCEDGSGLKSQGTFEYAVPLAEPAVHRPSAGGFRYLVTTLQARRKCFVGSRYSKYICDAIWASCLRPGPHKGSILVLCFVRAILDNAALVLENPARRERPDVSLVALLRAVESSWHLRQCSQTGP